MAKDKKQQPMDEQDIEIASKGHNKIGGIEVPKLKAYIERIEVLEEEKAGLAADVRDIYGEAKANGFDTKSMRICIALRKMKAEERTEAEYLRDLYMRALELGPELEEML